MNDALIAAGRKLTVALDGYEQLVRLSASLPADALPLQTVMSSAHTHLGIQWLFSGTALPSEIGDARLAVHFQAANVIEIPLLSGEEVCLLLTEPLRERPLDIAPPAPAAARPGSTCRRTRAKCSANFRG